MQVSDMKHQYNTTIEFFQKKKKMQDTCFKRIKVPKWDSNFFWDKLTVWNCIKDSRKKYNSFLCRHSQVHKCEQNVLVSQSPPALLRSPNTLSSHNIDLFSGQRTESAEQSWKLLSQISEEQLQLTYSLSRTTFVIANIFLTHLIFRWEVV